MTVEERLSAMVIDFTRNAGISGGIGSEWRADAAAVKKALAVFRAAIPMRAGHEGCITAPPCGSCFRCAFDAAVDAALKEDSNG